ncbi:efflux RND transporter periplasmic adaptor subunit [Chrysiogenes arsenatis]|uniref:efflux RND transporter periplasmic adaptor subunit n=1 Tax=Chrysiogenes arsenatis TaxID=309797 RepID=UPI0004166D0B|nr:efflux RND transporter periplasmic adaptor subunit [Chrysiogenes arsenatis]
MKKNIAVLVLVVLVVILGMDRLANLSKPGQAPSATRSATRVEVAPVKTGTIKPHRAFSATLESPERFHIASRISSTLQTLHVEIGDEVTSGQLLAELDDQQQKLALAQAEAEWKIAVANKDDIAVKTRLAQNNLERARSLRQQNITSVANLDQVKSEWEAQEARLRLAQAQVEQKQLQVEQARLHVSYTQIIATWDETYPRKIDRLLANRGSVVNAGTAIFSLVQANPLTAVVSLNQADYLALNPGDSVEIIDPHRPDIRTWGVVQRKSPAFDDQSRHARVEIELDNQAGAFAPGMFVQAVWVGTTDVEAQLVPLNALVVRDGEQGVFWYDAEKENANFITIVIGADDGKMVEIREPHLPGAIIVAGHERLMHGTKVTVTKANQP